MKHFDQRFIFAGALVLGSALSATAVAAPGAGSSSSSADYTALDTDRDGMVSKKEASKNKDLTKKFSTLDGNKDGKLDFAEFAQFEAAPSSDSSIPSSSPDASPTPKP